MLGQFKGKAPTAGAKPQVKKSRYAGIQNGKDRDPMPDVGHYRFRIVACEEGVNPGTLAESVKVRVQPVKVAASGDAYENDGPQMLCLFMRTTAGLSEFKRCIVASAGFEDAEAYDAFDPDGEFIGACVGEDNDYSRSGLTVIGRVVDCDVTRGKDAVNKKTGQPTGDWYRNFRWTVVSDDEQESVPSCVPEA
jgi:hypothetical protein